MENHKMQEMCYLEKNLGMEIEVELIAMFLIFLNASYGKSRAFQSTVDNDDVMFKILYDGKGYIQLFKDKALDNICVALIENKG